MAAALPQGPTHVECPEDEDFLSAFDRMVSDNIQDRMRETVKPQQVDISVPLHIKSSAKKTYGIVQYYIIVSCWSFLQHIWAINVTLTQSKICVSLASWI